MTPDQKIHIQYLLSRYLDGQIASKEEQQLFNYIEEEKDNTAWQELLEEFIAAEPQIIINKQEYQPILERILGRKGRNEFAKNAKLIPLYRRTAFKWIAAAAIIIAIATTAIVISKRSEKSPAAGVAKTNDVAAPTNTRAVITLADGTKVYLDSANNGTIANENNVAVVKDKEGAISYQPLAISQQPTAYNTLYNPRGSKVISLTLSDGTRVWLNSESSLRYPASFASTAVNREVEITGEAYFEVKHNAKQPFKVHLPNGSIVEDIGTAFNVNAYNDEDAIKTTLVEGAVKISAKLSDLSSSAVKLKPGEQLIQSPDHQITTSPDIDEVLSWRHNKFFFDGADIQAIARQLSRWYNVEVEIKDNIASHFTGIINRDVPVSQVFDMLQKTGTVKFSVEGKKIVITK